MKHEVVTVEYANQDISIEWKNVWGNINHCIVQDEDGQLWGIGDNSFGQMGNGEYSEEMQILTPVIMENFLNN